MRLKVLHVINDLEIGGAEKMLVEALPLYFNAGIDVDLVLLRGNVTPFKRELETKINGEIISLGLGSVYNPLHIFRLVKYLKSYKIVHVHLFPSLYYVGIAKYLAKSKVKLIFTEHSTNNSRISSGLFRWFDRIIYKNYNRVTAISPQVKEMLEEKLALRGKVALIYNGVNLEKLICSEALDRKLFFPDVDSKILVQISRFGIQKDQRTVIKSIALLPPYVKLLLVGDGEFRSECEDLVNDLKLRERVKFLGARIDVPQILKMSDIVIQSSHWEGFGLAAVEGMASGKPVIVSNVAGLMEIVQNSGLIFDSGDEIDLRDKVMSLLDDVAFYAETAQKCLNKSKDFSVKKMVDEFVCLYETI